MKKNLVCMAFASLALFGCGGGDDSTVAVAAGGSGSGGTINGSVSKGPVNSATVCAYAIDNAASGLV